MDRPAYFLANAAFIAAVAVPAILAWHGWGRGKAIALGWATIVIVTQFVAIFGYTNTQVFGWTKSQVQMPDAPDILPTALMAAAISAIAYVAGTAARFLFKRQHTH